VPPHRQGGQAQYVSTPLPEVPNSALAPLLDWARSRLDQALTLGLLAREADITARTLTRRFTAELGMPPLQWITSGRVRRSQQLLESTDLSIEQIADQCGLGTAANLRTHFVCRAARLPAPTELLSPTWDANPCARV
jgi:AraC family transcriptional activator FtrA